VDGRLHRKSIAERHAHALADAHAERRTGYLAVVRPDLQRSPVEECQRRRRGDEIERTRRIGRAALRRIRIRELGEERNLLGWWRRRTGDEIRNRERDDDDALTAVADGHNREILRNR
jgi:hypothetical protein